MSLTTPTTEQPVANGGAPGVAEDRPARWHLALIAVIAYVPLLLTKPGMIASDTKAYLYLDPRRLLSGARYMWNPLVGQGTVTHQNIGYLFPMGPWYSALHALGVPTWVAQRLWMGTLVFAAGAGVRYLARVLGVGTWGQLAAALPYMLTPFIVDYLARTSAILMPWAGLGWMVAFIVVAARRGGWRYPALFALVVALVGGVNATSVLLVGLAPALWLVLAGLTKEHPWSRVLGVTLKAGALSLVVSLWWIAGLWAEGSYGINVLRYTETFATVTMTSLASEVLRGLGYWYFYGNDKIQPWTQASSGYMLHTPGILVSFALPALSLAAAAFVRWRYRAYAILLIVIGAVLAVGAYPLNRPTPVGHVARTIGENSTIGLAMRSTNRVIPLIVLGLSLLLGAGVGALRARWRTGAVLAVAVVAALSFANMAPLFQGRIVASNLEFPETLPDYVTNTADYLNASGSTAVLGIPGLDFGYYRWGVTMDSVWPGLLTRPYIQRQAVLQGEPASANLLRALDESIQDGTFDPSTLAPMARLMGAGDVLLQSDTQFERYDAPRPQSLWLQLRPTPKGLRLDRVFGPVVPQGTEVGPIIDETQLAIAPGASYPPALAIYEVADPRALLRTESMHDPLVLAGDGEGIVLAAGSGLLEGAPRAIVYSASKDAAGLRALASRPGTVLVLTDTNARRLDTWGTLHTTYGYVRTPTERQLRVDPAQQPLPVFANRDPSTQTVLVLGGIKSVGASSYGNPVANAPEAQPLNALDGDPLTAWTVAAFSDPRGQFLHVGFLRPLKVSQVTLQQPQTGVVTRSITAVRLRFSDGTTELVRLNRSSQGAGQTVKFPAHTTSALTVTIVEVTGDHTDFSGASGVGFAEVRVPGVARATASLRLPTDLLSGAAGPGDARPLVVLMHRLRAATIPPRTDPELALSRTFSLPSARTFSVAGQARVNPLIRDGHLDALLGRGGGSGLRVVSTEASSRLAGELVSSSWSAFDRDQRTSWTPAFKAAGVQWASATLSSPLALSALTLNVVDDGRHSRPTSIRIVTDQGKSEQVALRYPPIALRHRPQGATTRLEIAFPALSGTSFRYSFPTQQDRTTLDHVSGQPIVLPIGIAEIQMPGVPPATTPTSLPGTCTPSLLRVDGHPVDVAVTGSTTDAVAQRPSSITGCGAPLTLAAGTHSVTTTPGYLAGWNVDTLSLSSPVALAEVAAQRTAQRTATLSDVRFTDAVGLSATVGAQSAPSWVVLNQSFSSGWRASLGGRDLGTPVLLDGGYTAWELPATSGGEALSVTWAPQRIVDAGLLASLAGLLVVGMLIVFGRSRRRASVEVSEAAERAARLSWPWTPERGPALVLTGAALVVVMAIAAPSVAIVIVPLVALLWWQPRLRPLLALAPAALVLAAGAYVAYQQHKHGWPHDIQWPGHFTTASTVAWVALSLLLVDAAAFGPGGVALSAPATSARDDEEVDEGPGPVSRALMRLLPERLVGPASVIAPGRVQPGNAEGEAELPAITLPAEGIARSIALLRAFRHEQDEPDLFYRTIALDTLHRMTGAAPLFNRIVVDVGGGPGYFADAFSESGARVILVEPEAASPLPRRLSGPEEQLDARSRHERAVWPGRLVPGVTVAGDGMNLPLPDDLADLVFSSNVLEHVADPARFIDEAVRVARPGGQVYLSFTAWFSPWGGHETSPWHLVGGRRALRRYERKHGHPPKNVYGESLFALRVSTVLKLVRQRNDVEVLVAEPRYLPRWMRWVVRVPVLREVVTWNLAVLLEKL